MTSLKRTYAMFMICAILFLVLGIVGQLTIKPAQYTITHEQTYGVAPVYVVGSAFHLPENDHIIGGYMTGGAVDVFELISGQEVITIRYNSQRMIVSVRAIPATRIDLFN